MIADSRRQVADERVSLDRGTTQAQHHVGHEHGGGVLFKALFFTLGFAIVEAVAGVWSGSLALLADAGHMLTDSTALGLAALAAWLAQKPPSQRFTYGLVRLEILAALFNSLLMLGLITFIVIEAVDRLANPQPVIGGAVMGVAFIGLLINLVVAWMLSHGGDGLNTRAALLHVLGDLLGSLAALIAGAVIWITGWLPIDPLLSIVVSGLILISAWRLLAESLHVLMEAVPAQVSVENVMLDLDDIPGVRRVHDLHIWTLSSGQIALSAHLELDSFDDWDRILQVSRGRLDKHHGIRHVTLQAELGSRQPCKESS
jgi:cobalt-zinc-cadmium efflux system protein